MNRKLLISLSAIGVTVLSGVGFMAYASMSNSQLKQIATEAVVLDHATPFYFRMMDTSTASDLGILHTNHRFNGVDPAMPLKFLVSMLSTAPNLSSKVNLSASDITNWDSRTSSFINQVFLPGSNAYNYEMAMLKTAEGTLNSSNVVPIDGGIRNLQWNSVSVNQDTAVLEGTGDAWGSFGHWQNGAYTFASPHNEMIYTVTLKQTNNSWKVTDLSWAFAPGSQP